MDTLKIVAEIRNIASEGCLCWRLTRSPFFCWLRQTFRCVCTRCVGEKTQTLWVSESLKHFFSEEAPGDQNSRPLHVEDVCRSSVPSFGTHLCTSSVLLCQIVLGPENGTSIDFNSLNSKGHIRILPKIPKFEANRRKLLISHHGNKRIRGPSHQSSKDVLMASSPTRTPQKHSRPSKAYIGVGKFGKVLK